ncbi:hypothetical protein K435DRAFT_832004 [Dendrothele bispora CBS 962.96]|uniref:Phospholipase/carboxylesterase/thioesterase domain-containing protein n=1 Tax=Dendrothele bispora (strain CBS 962.96) TaxID=1314807 RepID=A0A4S8KWQ7_DENBC|nr:hypothetical protein K435DRAFT_832004 [Dendrothele bispora CBS 962.96]
MPEIHLRTSSSQPSPSPKVKSPPKPTSNPTPFSYHPSDDGTDENLLILLHGLGDTHIPFSKLGKQFKLPQTAVLAIRAPEQIPYLYTESYQWYPSFSPLGDLLTDPNPTPALTLLSTVLDHLTSPQECAWPLDRIHLFGFAQGGSVALEFGLRVWREREKERKKEEEKKENESEEMVKERSAPILTPPSSSSLGSIISISGPLLSYPTVPTPPGPSPTPILLVYRPPPSDPSLSTSDLTAIRKAYSNVREVRMPVKIQGTAMPSSREEWEGIMRFWSERLSRRQVEGVYEVLSGMNG